MRDLLIELRLGERGGFEAASFRSAAITSGLLRNVSISTSR
jgi:hypothetical protein